MTAYDLVPEWQVGELVLTNYPYSVDRDSTVDIGEPEVVVDTVTSLLADGDIEQERRAGNRTYSLTVYVEGTDLAEVALNEAALRQELRRTGLTLTHRAGDSIPVPASVYDVLVARMKVERQDPHESHMIRRVVLTLTCAPFARSANLVTVPALDAPSTTPVTATVTTADATTNWAATGTTYTGSGPSTAPVTVYDMGTYILASIAGTWPSLTLTYTPLSPVDMSATPYLVVEAGGSSPSFRVTLDGVSRKVVPILSRATDAGTTLHVLNMAGTSLTSLTLFADLTGSSGTQPVMLNVHDVSRTNVLPQISTRQITRVIDVGGTERTPGSIHVETAEGIGTGLGLAIVHTSPEDGTGYSPPLRRWRVAGQTPTFIDTTISGAFESILTTGVADELPTSALPEGGYILAAYMRVAEPETMGVAYSASTIFPGGSTEEGFVNGLEQITFPDDGWRIVPIATLSLPTVRTKAGKVRIILQVPSGAIQTYVDEAWLFRVDDDCALTILTTDYQHVWLNSAGVDAPVPTVWVGDDDTVRVHPSSGLLAQGTHVLSPEGTAVFTAALSENPSTEATFYRRWHSNAAE